MPWIFCTPKILMASVLSRVTATSLDLLHGFANLVSLFMAVESARLPKHSLQLAIGSFTSKILCQQQKLRDQLAQMGHLAQQGYPRRQAPFRSTHCWLSGKG